MKDTKTQDMNQAHEAAILARRAKFDIMLRVSRELTGNQERLLEALDAVDAARSEGQMQGMTFRPRTLNPAADAVATFEKARAELLELQQRDPLWLATEALFFERRAASDPSMPLEALAWSVAVEASHSIYLSSAVPPGMPGAEPNQPAFQRAIAALLVEAAQRCSTDVERKPVRKKGCMTLEAAKLAWDAELIQTLAVVYLAAMECVRFYAPMVSPGDEIDVDLADCLLALLDCTEAPFELLKAAHRGQPPATLPGGTDPINEVCSESEFATYLLLDLAEGSMEARTLAYYGGNALCSLLKLAALAHGIECFEAFQSLCADDPEFAHALGIKPLSA